MIENRSSEGVCIENNENIDRKKKKKKHDKSIDSVPNKNNDVSSDSLNAFLINMFSDGSTDDWSVRNKKKKNHLEIGLENNHIPERNHSDEDAKRPKTGEKRRHSESETLTNNKECFVRNVTHNSMTEFFQVVHSKNNSISDEQQMLNQQESTPKKPKKMKLEVKTPESDINRKQIEGESAQEETVLKKKDKHKVTENFTENQLENEVRQKRKHSVGDKNTETYNGDVLCEKNNSFHDSTPKKSKKIKFEMKTPETEDNHKHKASISENEVKKKKKKHKDKSDDRNRHNTSASSISENSCSNPEDPIPSKKKKKKKHKDEVPVIPSQEEVYDVPQIKKKKKRKHKDKIHKSLPIKIKMRETDRLLEDSYLSTDYSMNNGYLSSPAVQNTPHVDDLNPPHKKWQEISSDLYNKAEEQRESSHEVAIPENVSSPDTYTIEVQEDKGGTLNGSFSPNDKKKRPTVNKESKKKCFDESVEEEDYDYIIAQRLDETHQNSTLDEDKLRLGRLYILTSFTVPPLHLIETRVANRPSPKQKAQIDLLGVKVKTGIFTKLEDEKIRHNFKDFCREHDLPEDPTPFLNFVHDQEVLLPCLERIKFVRYLARDLNDRLLCSVYKRFRRLFRQSEIKTGKFTKDEDKIIMHYVTTRMKTQTPFADLGRILKREKQAVEKRYKKLITAPSEKIKWTSDRIKELLEALMNVTGCGTTEELRYRDITYEDWTQVSSSLKVPMQKIRYAWLYYIYPKLFSPSNTNTDEIRIRLVNLLRDKKETDWRALNWDEIAQNFEGFTGASLNKLLKDNVSNHVPPSKQRDLGKSLKYLSKKHSNTNLKSPQSKKRKADECSSQNK